MIKPTECAAFGTTCTPRTPLGATMVSSEGACAAYYLYRRMNGQAPHSAPAPTGTPGPQGSRLPQEEMNPVG
jgi:hydrogenase expression/formation protein HypD